MTAGPAEPSAGTWSPTADPSPSAGVDARPGVRRDVVGPAVLVVLLGALAGLVWWWLAPTGAVVQAQGYLAPVPDGSVESPGDTWGASQDAVYAAVVVGGGVLSGVVAVARAGRGVGALVRWAAVVVAGLGAALVAWGLGVLLGPDPVAVQEAAGADPLVSPLGLSSLAPLLLWPAATCVVVFAVALVSLLVHPPTDDAPDV